MTDKKVPRVGCVYLPQFAPERLAETAKAADDAGLDELWLWEDCFLSGGISGAAIALSHSSTLTVGVGVLPVPMRNVALTAMEIATLSRAFPGRVRIGVGHGVQNWMAQIGEKVASPMTLLREYLTCLRALLRGERVTFHGRYVNLDDVALDWPPEPGIELLVGAMGPKTLRLSGQLADGTIIAQGTSAETLRAAVAHIRNGDTSHKDRPSSVAVYVLATTGVNYEADMSAEYERWNLTQGTPVSVCGSAADIATGLLPWVDAGADTIVLTPSIRAGIEEYVDFVGRQVRPLVRSPNY